MFRRNPNKTARELSHNNFEKIINDSDLDEMSKTLLKSRFLNEIKYYDYKRDDVKIYYDTFRFLVTTGSIILPAILSIGQMDEDSLPENFENILYWSSWGISLVVTASNGFTQLFSLDKKYYDYALTSEQLKSEAWEYFELCGKYEDYIDHKQSFKQFCTKIETIKNGQIAREFSGKADNGDKNNNKYQMNLHNSSPSQEDISQKQNIIDTDNTNNTDDKSGELLKSMNLGIIPEGNIDSTKKTQRP